MRILFHANASKTIGIGHLLRTYALAQSVVSRGNQVGLITGPESPDSMIEKWRALGDVFITKQGGPGSQYSVQEALCHVLRFNGDWLVIDGYDFEQGYLEAIKKEKYRLVMIDDLADMPFYDCDVIVNQNIDAGVLEYPSRKTTKALLGSRYVLLRTEFHAWRGWRRRTPPIAKKILVTLGGTADREAIWIIIKALDSACLQNPQVKLVTGPLSGEGRRIREYALLIEGKIEVIKKVDDMPKIMAWADIAISAGGTTCYEMAFMGLPNLIVVVAENQRIVAEGLSRKGCSVNLGLEYNLTSTVVANGLKGLAYDTAKRERMTQRGQELIDGRGGERVISELF